MIQKNVERLIIDLNARIVQWAQYFTAEQAGKDRIGIGAQNSVGIRLIAKTDWGRAIGKIGGAQGVFIVLIEKILFQVYWPVVDP